MPLIENKLNGSLIIRLDTGRMVFLEPKARMEIPDKDMSSSMLVQFLEEGKIVLGDKRAGQGEDAEWS